MKKIKHKVEYIMKNFPETRNSDWKVAFKVWSYLGIDFSEQEKQKFMKAHSLGSFYTIERHARKVRAENPNLKGTKEVEKERNNNYFVFKNDALKDTKPNGMDNYLNK